MRQLEARLALARALPPVCADDEPDLVERARSGDHDALERLLASNQLLLVRLARPYLRPGTCLSDLVQQGNLGLMHALKKYDATRGVRFMTYASCWARAYMRQHVLRNLSLVPSSARLRHGGADAGAGDLRADVSLSSHAEEGEPDFNPLRWLPAEGPSPLEALEARREQQRAASLVRSALSGLSGRERTILELRLLSEEPATLQELGDHLGFSRERARQLEARATAKVRRRIRWEASSAERAGLA